MWGSVYRRNLYWLADCPRLVWSTQHLFYGDVARDNYLQWRFLVQHSIAMLEQCCGHSKQCHNNVATLFWAKNCHCESSHVTLPIVIYLFLLFIPLASCGGIGNSFNRTSCGKSNITWGKSTLNSVNLLCLRVIVISHNFLQTFVWCTNVCNVLWLCWAIAYGPSGPCQKLEKTMEGSISLH